MCDIIALNRPLQTNKVNNSSPVSRILLTGPVVHVCTLMQVTDGQLWSLVQEYDDYIKII